jgi:hypothetical protein
LERSASALLGLWASLLVGIVLGFWLAPGHSLSIDALAVLALASAIAGALFGALFPKLTRCIALPFSVIGVGIGGSN